ncbi:EAL domain-containing protein [Loktanella fryxellensis]|nr:EAL domain-containing protein [Loktanella fryxellensis]
MIHHAPPPAAILAHPDVTLIDGALTAVRQLLDMPLAVLIRFDGADVVLDHVSSHIADTAPPTGHRCPAPGSYWQAVRDDIVPQVMPDTAHDPQAMALAAACPVAFRAAIAVPLRLHGSGAAALFCCLSDTARPMLAGQDHAVVLSFAGLVGRVAGRDPTADPMGRSLRQRIDDVIADRDFQLLLQPIAALASGTVTGAEALCRFRPTPYRSPDRWFADAHGVGLGRALERSVVAKAMEVLPDLPRALTLSINVSLDMLASDDLPALIDGPFSDRVVFELTDHAGVQNPSTLRDRIKRLRQLGARVAVDDLSASYASLSTVLQIKPDIIKIDRTLVRSIHLDPASQALAAGLVHFAQAIGATVVAEGIEHAQEARCLRDLGVSHGQGFLLGRPGSLTALQTRTYLT